MSGWHRPDVEAAALAHLTTVVGPVSARQIVDGLLAKGRAEQAARVAELEQQAAVVAKFVAARAEYITSIRNCHPDNAHDYHRWQGHAESRRQLAQTLGLPVAWPAEGGAR